MINSKRKRGFGLLVVLLVTSMMAGFAVICFQTSQTQLFRVAGFSQHMQALVLAKAGVNLARAGLLLDKNDKDDLEEEWSTLAQASQMAPIALGNGFVSIDIIDEERKNNINQMDDKRLKEFFKAAGLRSVKKGDVIDVDIIDETVYKELAESFLDWTDEDNDEREDGAESRWYKNQEFVFKEEKIEVFPHNYKLGTPGELLWIKGFGPDMLFGKNGNPRLIDMITVYGDGKININTADRGVLETLLKQFDEFGYEFVLDAVMDNRPYQNLDMAKSIISQFGGGGYVEELGKMLKIKSEYFRIIATGIIGKTESIVEAIVKRTEDSCDILLWLERETRLIEEKETKEKES